VGVENIENVNRGLRAASPWYLKYGVNSMDELR
jgi:tagatose 1,6-diphosphate aldolase